MKLRIGDHSFRFRISPEELDQLAGAGWLEERVGFPSKFGTAKARESELDESGIYGWVEFVYRIERDEEILESELQIRPYTISLHICRSDLDRLQESDRESISISRQVEDSPNHRGQVLLEKDRLSWNRRS